MEQELVTHIRGLAEQNSGPFYVYVRQRIADSAAGFLAIPYANKAIHFASMANSHPEFLDVVRAVGLKVFVNSVGHLQVVQAAGFQGHDVVYTASAMDDVALRAVHAAGTILNLDSLGQLQRWWQLFPDAPVGLRCNIGELVEARGSRGGFFLGKQSRLGLTLDEIARLEGSPLIAGLHLYVGTDIVDLDYFRECYGHLAQLARRFPQIWYLDFGGGFGLATQNGHGPAQPFPLQPYGAFVTQLMQGLSDELGRSLRLILEPGRIIGGEAGHFVCRVTDVKRRNGTQLIGVNGSSAQFPRPLFYPDDAHHPVTLLANLHDQPNGTRLTSSVYGCSTYSRDFLSVDVTLPEARVGDLLVFGQAGSYCAAAHTQFLGFPAPAQFFV